MLTHLACPPPHKCLNGRVLCLLLALSAAAMLAGCGEEREPLSPTGYGIQLTSAQKVHARQLVADYGCVACHTVPGVKGAGSGVGPPLENMALRGYIAGVLPNTPANLVQWLMNPPAVDPRTAMPNMGLSREEATAIAAYLLTLY